MTNQNVAQRVRGWVFGFRGIAAVGAGFAAIAPAVMATRDQERQRELAEEEGVEAVQSLRGSVSAYWDVDPSIYFWLPFTVAAALLLADGIISIVEKGRQYRNRWFNIPLGLALLLLTWRNVDEHAFWHYLGAGVFFGLFIVVILYTVLLGLSTTSRRIDRGDEKPEDVNEELERTSARVSGIFLGLLALTLVLWRPIGWISFYFFEVLALFNFALFHIQGYRNPFPYHRYEFKSDLANRIFRWKWLPIMSPAPKALPTPGGNSHP